MMNGSISAENKKKVEEKVMEKKAKAKEFVSDQVESILKHMVTIWEFADAMDIDFNGVFSDLSAQLAEKKKAAASEKEKEPEIRLDMDEVVDRVSEETGLSPCCVYRVLSTAFDIMRDMGVTGLDLVTDEEDDDEE